MATSDLGARVLGYLGSTRNIVGSVLAVVALAVTVPTRLAGPLWPVVVAGVYGIGALLAPRDRASSTSDGPSTALSRAAELSCRLDDLRDEVHGTPGPAQEGRTALPDDVVAAFDRIEVGLRGLLSRADKLADSPAQLGAIGSIITDFVPNALTEYADLPTSVAMRRIGDRPSPHEHVLAQLALLAGELDEITAAVYAGNVRRLEVLSGFLRDKFSPSELDLDVDADGGPPAPTPPSEPGRRAPR